MNYLGRVMTKEFLTQNSHLSETHAVRGSIAILNASYANLCDYEPIDPAIIAQCEMSGLEVLPVEATSPKGADKPCWPADLGLIDLRQTFLHLEMADKIVLAAKNYRFQILFLLSVHTPEPIIKRLSHAGRIYLGEDLIGCLHDEFREMIRAKTIYNEFNRRKQSLDNFNDNSTVKLDTISSPAPAHPKLSIPSPAQGAPKTTLIAGKPGREILSLINALMDNGHTVKCAYRPGQAIRALESNMIDGAVFFPSQKGDPLIALARTMRRHTRFKSIPVIHVVPDRHLQQDMMFTIRGANSVLSCDHIMPCGGILIDNIFNFTKTISSMQAQLRATGLDHADHMPVIRDELSLLFSSEFFAHHTHALIKNADCAERPLNFLAINIARAKDINISNRKILNQIGPLINRVIRAEDFIGQIGTNRYGLVCATALNSSHDDKIHKIAGRITSIIHNTMFYDNQGGPISLVANANVYTREAGLCIEETVAGILNSVR